ncbi:Ricin-type beta-trefoil [Mactra antiquata]
MAVQNVILLCTIFMVYFMKSAMPMCPDVENKDRRVFQFENPDICYEYVETTDETVTYSDAMSNCNSRNGALLSIPNNETQVAMVHKLTHLSDSHTVLLGLRRENNVWKWPSGEATTFTNWQVGTEQCRDCNCAKMLLQENGQWERIDCNSAEWYTVFVCEYGNAGSSINKHDVKQQVIDGLKLSSGIIQQILNIWKTFSYPLFSDK